MELRHRGLLLALAARAGRVDDEHHGIDGLVVHGLTLSLSRRTLHSGDDFPGADVHHLAGGVAVEGQVLPTLPATPGVVRTLVELTAATFEGVAFGDGGDLVVFEVLLVGHD